MNCDPMNNKQTLVMAIATICCITCIALRRAGATESQPTVRHGSCHHVINQVARYGVNNSVNVLNTRGVMTAPVPFMFGGAINTEAIGDLEILHVGVIQTATPSGGPQFSVVVKNNSCREVCGMQLSAVALLGTIHPMSPTTILSVPSIAAGGTIELSVVLPVDALTMGNYNRTAVGFDRLLVAVDSSDEFAEADEANNLKLYELSTLITAAQPPRSAPMVDPAQSVDRPDVLHRPSVQPAPNDPPLSAPAPETTGDIERSDLRTAMQRMSESG